MDEIPQAEIQEICHLGLVAAVVKKFKISEKINLLLPKESNNQKINHAQAILAMIYQGLGFGDGRLYFEKDFFSNKPMDVTFRSRNVTLNNLYSLERLWLPVNRLMPTLKLQVNSHQYQ